jgi:cbb3-type cytochrome oxidase maturation protein
MSVLFVVVPLAFLLAGGFLAAFLWSVKRGQFDDVEGDAVRVLFDDDAARTAAGKDPLQRSQKSFQTMRATNASADSAAATNSTSGSAG